MRYERIPIASGSAVTVDEVQEHLRVDDDLLSGAMAYAHAAQIEVEQYADIALLEQTIIATTEHWPGQIIDLPVGPVQPGGTATVAIIETDGSATPLVSGFWLEAGRYPRLHLGGEPGGRIRISYTAGFGDQGSDIPADLRHALLDTAARL
ncbi:MAG: hypothetical protein P3W90_000675 [Paracoccus sp. (in: a-proteobacteria)]|nr:hypothetical protein [Paracoccus sp. (in: a-proteobacteria)]